LRLAIRRVKGAKRLGVPVGNWLSAEQGKRLLLTPDCTSLRGKRDYATLAILLGCGLRRAELTALRVEDIQQREEHWVIADLVGKGGHIRTIPIPDWVMPIPLIFECPASINVPTRKRRLVTSSLSRHTTFVGLVPVFVIRPAVSWSRFSSFLGMSLC